MDEDDEKICRYCFDGEEEDALISPCKCAGGQKYVHLKCLRQWQRMVLVSQPTHPAFYDRDLRHQTCNVCPEIAALIDGGCIIAAHEVFSDELNRQIEESPMPARYFSSYRHWIRGVYLITSIDTEETGIEKIDLDTASELQNLRRRLGDSLSMSIQGKRLSVVAGGSLENVPSTSLSDAFAQLQAPCTICFAPDEPPNCGDDHVVAINLTRPLPRPPRQGQAMVDRAVASVVARYRSASQVQITHFIGGPCEEDDLMCCVVLGGSGCGWKVLNDLERAVELACSRAAKRFDTQGEICGGQTVQLKGLQSCPELNGEVGLTLRFAENTGRWLVRLRNGEGKQIKPANLEPLEGAGGRVFAIWGDARWSRAQLLGEIARGHWGLCRANIGDLTSGPSERWAHTAGRLAFAPQTDMTEDFMREEMIRRRQAVQMHQPAASDEEPDPDE